MTTRQPQHTAEQTLIKFIKTENYEIFETQIQSIFDYAMNHIDPDDNPEFIYCTLPQISYFLTLIRKAKAEENLED